MRTISIQFAKHRRVVLLAALPILAAACADSSRPTGPGEPPITGNVIAGEAAFLAECASCHAARDGFDLAFFAFPDTTIVRRALGHVELPTAHDIVAYIRTLRAPHTGRTVRIFQPGDVMAISDVAIGTRLFGTDLFPEDLTTAQMLAVDPRDVAVALEFPLWSFEESNLDWMPDAPVADALLDWAGPRRGPAREWLERYYASRRTEDLLETILRLRLAERLPDNPDAPCVMEPFDRFRPRECFEARRWIATLGAQHMLRAGVEDPVHPIIHDAWWDVGNASRRSRQTDETIDNAIVNWTQWMYLGFAFNPQAHASVYLSLGLTALGLPRHATFHILRSQVVRGPGSRAPYHDARNAARFAPAHWTYAATAFSFRNLLERQAAGGHLRWEAEAFEEARMNVEEAFNMAMRQGVDGDRALQLAALRDQILAGLH